MTNRIIVHLDMDAFFAAIEQRDYPQLQGKPVVVGANPKRGTGRGVVSTCSYEARTFGIHSAMPISKAYKCCPHALFLPVNMEKYKNVSNQLMEILKEFSPDIEPISIDEAFLDLTGCSHFYGGAAATCKEIKGRIKDKLNLSASIGIAPNKMIAKIASDYCKPNGLIEISQDKLQSFLWALTIDKMWGIGSQLKQSLNQLNIYTIGDLADFPKADLIDKFGERGHRLHLLAHGIDDRQVKPRGQIKSLSHEHTFMQDESDCEQVLKVISLLSQKVSRRLRKKKITAKTVTLKVRQHTFKTVTVSYTFGAYGNYFEDINNRSKELFKKIYVPNMRIRLIGVKMSQLSSGSIQNSLFEYEEDVRREKIHSVVDNIKDKFGEAAILRAGNIMQTSKKQQ